MQNRTLATGQGLAQIVPFGASDEVRPEDDLPSRTAGTRAALGRDLSRSAIILEPGARLQRK
jgi:hypothetical protein